jgi:hypothetical protein
MIRIASLFAATCIAILPVAAFAQHSETAKPAETTKPIESTKPAETTKTAETMKPVAPTGIMEQAKPAAHSGAETRTHSRHAMAAKHHGKVPAEMKKTVEPARS